MNSASEKKYGLSRAVPRVLKISVQLIAGTLAVASVIIAALLWRMSEGPISLNFLRPHLEPVLTNSNSPRIPVFQDLNISWSGWAPYIVLQAKQIELNPSEGKFRTTIPKITAQLSVPALFRGVFVFKHVEITDPSLEVPLHYVNSSLPHNKFDFFENHMPTFFFELYELTRSYFLAILPHFTFSQVEELTISNPSVAIWRSSELLLWKATSEKCVFKQTAGTIDINFDLTLAIKGTELPVNISAKLEKNTGMWHTQLLFSDLFPPQLTQISKNLKTATNFRTPLSGKFSTKFSDISSIRTIDFELASLGGLSSFAADSWFSGEYDVKDAQIAGRIIPTDLAIFVDRFNGNLDGVEVHGSAAITNLQADPHIEAEFNAAQIPINHLSRLWPQNLATGARAWVVQNISGGTLNDVTAYINFFRSDLTTNALSRGQIFGQFQVSDTSVKYMNGLPPAQNIRGAGWFDGLDFHISINDGTVLNQDISGTNIDFLDIYTGTEIGIVQLQSHGPLADLLRLTGLSQNTLPILPTGIAQNIEGVSTAAFEVRFPLVKTLAAEHLTITGELKFNDLSLVKLPQSLWGDELKITNGLGTILLTGSKTTVNSNLMVNNIPMEIRWVKFPESQPSGLASKATVRTTISDSSIKSWKQLLPFSDGELQLVVEINLFDDSIQEAIIAIDISDYKISLPAMPFSKTMGVQAAVVGRLQLNSWIPTSPLYFEIVSDELGGSGVADLNNNFELTKLSLDSISHQEDIFTAEIFFTDGELQKIDLYTNSLEIGPNSLEPEIEMFKPQKANISAAKMTAGMFASMTDVEISYSVENQDTTLITIESEELTLEQSLISMMEAVQKKSEQRSDDSFNISGFIKKMHSEHGEPLINVQGKGTVRGGELIHARLEAYFSQTEKVRIELTGSGIEQKIIIASDNAGKFLQLLGVASNLVGGKLYLEAKYGDHGEEEKLVGHCTVRDFHVMNTPLLAQLLSISVPTNVFELLAGKGVPFARLHAPFKYGNSTLQFIKARATGISLGITFDGDINLDADYADLHGTIIPAYLLNNIVGTVPVIGDILTGSEKEGIFAANYTAQGPINDPEIFVNPLTVLAPGILREFFDLFISDKTDSIQ